MPHQELECASKQLNLLAYSLQRAGGSACTDARVMHMMKKVR